MKKKLTINDLPKPALVEILGEIIEAVPWLNTVISEENIACLIAREKSRRYRAGLREMSRLRATIRRTRGKKKISDLEKRWRLVHRRTERLAADIERLVVNYLHGDTG